MAIAADSSFIPRTHRFDVVAVGIEQKRGMILGAEREMSAFARRFLVEMQPRRRRVLMAEAGAAVVA